MKKVIKAGNVDISMFIGNGEKVFKKIDEKNHQLALVFFLMQTNFNGFDKFKVWHVNCIVFFQKHSYDLFLMVGGQLFWKK